jgi:hypothetical protein
MKSLRPEYLPEMDAVVIGVAGGEVLLRWLAEVKNTEEHGAEEEAPMKLQHVGR